MLAALGPVLALAASGDAVWVGRFGAAADAWREVQIKPELAKNRFAHRRWDGVDALEVFSNASMSLKARPLTVDLDATPVLCWRWRIAAPIASANLQQRQGDDYAARVYVSFKLPDAALGPRGAQGVPLTPGRSVAVDRSVIALGTPLWLDSSEPLSTTPLQRLVMAQHLFELPVQRLAVGEIAEPDRAPGDRDRDVLAQPGDGARRRGDLD